MPPSQLLQLQLEDDINFLEKETIIVYVGHYDENSLHLQAERALLPVAQSLHLSEAAASGSNQF